VSFALHPNLEATSVFVADLALSQARLQDDARFPWLVLVPRVAVTARDLDDLSPDQRGALIEEIAAASAAVRRLGEAQGRPVEKLNVAAIGLVTPQLHLHVLGRRRDDGLWPDPVWGRGTAVPYDAERLAELVRVAAEALESPPARGRRPR
jgi:diadenosine tetraphosphate (Ap4A) HIT family hydrolase